jgi:Gluconate 2-dehydrogenase subunit 3
MMDVVRKEDENAATIERRNLLKILAVGTIAPQLQPFASAAAWYEQLVALAQLGSASQYHLQILTPEESELVAQLSEMIIPADAHSPGARAANVNLFADLMLATSDEQTKQQWRHGLSLIKEEAEKSSLADALAKASANEADPKMELEHFFVALKQMTVDGYYTSSIGLHQELGYQGNSYLSKFPGCTHPEHQG